MINFSDSIGTKRAIEFSLSYNGKYISLTLWADRRTNADTIQIPRDLLQELIDNLTNLKETTL